MPSRVHDAERAGFCGEGVATGRSVGAHEGSPTSAATRLMGTAMAPCESRPPPVPALRMLHIQKTSSGFVCVIASLLPRCRALPNWVRYGSQGSCHRA